MKIFKSKIDKLEQHQKDLIKEREIKLANVNYVNSKIGAEIKRLEEKMYRNREDYDKYSSQIDLELERNSKLIIAEADYAKEISSKYQPIVKAKKTTKK